MLRKLFKTGNSIVVSLPKDIIETLGHERRSVEVASNADMIDVWLMTSIDTPIDIYP